MNGRTNSVLVYFVAVLFSLVGLAALVGAGWRTVANIRFSAAATKTEGTIVKFDQRHSASSGRRRGTTVTWAPVFEFADAAGVTQRVASSHSSSHPGRKVGDRVPVLYLPSEPHRARINSFASFWPVPLILTGLGAGFSGFDLVMSRPSPIEDWLWNRFAQEAGMSVFLGVGAIAFSLRAGLQARHSSAQDAVLGVPSQIAPSPERATPT